MKISFENKVGLVTGGASGIGKAVALATAGAKVAVAGRRENEGREVVEAIEKLGGHGRGGSYFRLCELHLEIIRNRSKREFEVEANAGPPQVAYRENHHQTSSRRRQIHPPIRWSRSIWSCAHQS